MRWTLAAFVHGAPGMKMLKWLCVIAIVVCVLPRGAGARSAPYTAFYAFGDSLADNGNTYILTQLLGIQPAIPPSVSPHRSYDDRRFSNGPVAFEYLWQMLSGSAPGSDDGLTPFLEGPLVIRHRAIDFAFGGSGTGLLDQTPGGFSAPGLRAQVELYRALLANKKVPPRALYAIFAGAGDYLRPTPLDPTESVGNIIASVRTLYSLGARTVIVLNLPDLGSIPMFAGTPQSTPLSQLTAAHNALLAAQLADLQASLPDLRLVPIDLNAVLPLLPPSINATVPALDALLPAQPGQLPASLCVFVNPAVCQDAPTFDVGLQFLFWDAEHPTTAVHQQLAAYIASQLPN
jgi:phospholipase/lecithinase/hemolysin